MPAALCDICGFRYKHEELKERWDGYMVCDADFETRHPQDFVRAVPDNKPLQWTRPYPAVNDVGVALNSATHTTKPTGTFDSNNGTL